MSLGMVFPGQGSQFVGMLGQFAQTNPIVADVFAQASAALGYDLWALTQNGPAEELNQTQHTQPALLAASYAVWKTLHKKPELLAGHSLGEYTALVCANAISFSDAIKLVAARGNFMQAAVPADVGAMAAIVGLEDSQVIELCKEAKINNEVLAPANFNSIGQVVIAGNKNSVLNAIEIAKTKGAKIAKQIPVSVPSHCELMRPAAEQLEKMMQTINFSQPEITVINNVEVKAYTDANSIRAGLKRQLYMPVRWVETIEYFANHGVQQIIECGPGKVLCGLNKRINKNIENISSVTE